VVKHPEPENEGMKGQIFTFDNFDFESQPVNPRLRHCWHLRQDRDR
jgi:hypothetical protein